MTIYDYKNNAFEISFPNNPIYSIDVSVVSGDEVVVVEFENGMKVKIDAADYSGGRRIIDHCDGSYQVTGNNIEKWLRFKPNKKHLAAYERMRMFFHETY